MPSVLIVDDEYGIAEMARELLKLAGYEVSTAVNGKLALAAVECARPDLILLDLMMPIMSGIEVIQRLKASDVHRDIPVIMMSAAGLDAIDEEVRPLMAGFLLKPFTFRELLAAMQQVLAE
jgi:DNA-binding response OmpR family regulator